MGVVIAPMHEIIEDYGRPTHSICLRCRSANPPRFRFLQEITFQEADPNKPRDWYVVCPHCDVAVESR